MCCVGTGTSNMEGDGKSAVASAKVLIPKGLKRPYGTGRTA